MSLTGSACRSAVPATRPRHVDATASTDSTRSLGLADRVRLAEAFRLDSVVGRQVWPTWRAAPFAVLLVTPSHEFLVGHPYPTPDFRAHGFDSVLAKPVHVRARVFPTGMLATFPAVAGVPTIVMGQPEQTGLTSTRWVLTVLHEHFHQLQYSQPGYYRSVNALGLARGDTTGGWMLTYAFPYQQPDVQRAYAAYSTALADLLDAARRGDALSSHAAALRTAARGLTQALPPDDQRYLDFQLWQEGVARYTELAVARLAAAHDGDAAPAFRNLPDVVSYGTEAERIERAIRGDLLTPALGTQGRVTFYSLGAATALALDVLNPGWRSRYLASDFRLLTLLSLATP